MECDIVSATYPVMQGAEPFYHEGSSIGILVCHGFTGTTQSMRPLGEAYKNFGFTVCGPRLKGHGTSYEEKETTSYHDWIASIEEGLQWLKERCHVIFVTGLSMGGTLTLYLAEKYPEVKGIIPINAAVSLPAMEALLQAEHPRYIDAIGSDIKDPNSVELAYEKTPTKSVEQIVELVKVVRMDLNKIICPALIFVSDEDHVVPPDNSMIIFENISSDDKELYRLTNSYHVATLDYDQSIIINLSLAFINRVLNK